MGDEKAKRLSVRRQQTAHQALTRVGMEPVLWQTPDGSAWVEETYADEPKWELTEAQGDTHRLTFRQVIEFLKQRRLRRA